MIYLFLRKKKQKLGFIKSVFLEDRNRNVLSCLIQCSEYTMKIGQDFLDFLYMRV